MTMDREKEREIELESAMYTNCLLLGLDPSIIGLGASNVTPRVGLFRHSNPKLGEQLLYFILSSLRGPAQSARDFDRVWPIFDSAQSRDFRKVVQGIISELEAQGALPRSNSRVSSLATCCGPRFVELLWQLSLHALREVYRRNFAADVASNPLPVPLTDVAFSHAATLLPVTKARISLERRRFLKNAETTVQRQAMWSNLAHEMTAEFRGLCAEEAYLQQELEKLHDLRNKVKLEGELWDDLVSTSSQNSHLVSKTTRLWESILSRKSQHEVLASGPIEDLIAHREHRYRISGSSLLATMDQSSQAPYSDVLSVQSGDLANKDQNGGCSTQVNEETFSQVDDRSGRVNQTVDVAEIIRRWTHALQRIHKHSLQLANANDGEGPDILRSAQDGSTSGHAESLATSLAEHQQHLASFQVLINQLKEVAPAIQKSISNCTEKVNGISSNLPSMAKHHGQATSPIQAQSSGRTLESSSDDVGDITPKMSKVQLDKISPSSPALKLPQLFSLSPNSLVKSGNMQKQHTLAPQTNQIETLSESSSLDQPLANNGLDNPPQDTNDSFVQNLKRSVRQAALSVPSHDSESSRDSQSDESSEHFFVPISSFNFYHGGPENKVGSITSKKLFSTQKDNSLLDSRASDGRIRSNYDDISHMLNKLDSLNDYDPVNVFLSAAASSTSASDGQRSFFDLEEAQDVFSPSFLMDASLLSDSYEDLLAPLSETDTALMEH
ncbi:AUGMIN subunit 6-like isoform X1 [Gossypium arboreum]|uniref:AUGMIN subunit 6-like isoform X1 n=1 Tax=Gossypium arboreum TaxID=29729 RepID=UPI000819232A|nr:AUGMIN subunit 6-like isoform X1 [Gossypium arboreum]XP_017647264.1 AUGMIN subunit 6-like isoform X1 [Gossypium arboreum]